MNALESAVAGILDKLVSHVQTLGYFARVQMHEPKNAPGSDLTCAIFLSGLSPVAVVSSLDATSVRVEMTARIYKPFLSMPTDLIDLSMAMATCSIMAAVSGDFDLGGTVRNVDLLGAHGAPLSARAGYQTVDKTTFRIMDIVIPMIVNDAFTQSA